MLTRARNRLSAFGGRLDRGLAVAVFVAALVRLNGLDFGLPHPLCRPDEDAIASVATRFYHGHMNPQFFSYPALFMLAVAACLAAWLGLGWLLGYLRDRAAMDALVTTTTVHMTARLLSAAAGVASVWAVFRIASRLFDRTTALVAAAFLALAFLHVRDSHFGVTDVAASFMALAAFLFILDLAESGSARDLASAAVASGLATSTKYNVALIAVPALLVILGQPSALVRRLLRVSLFLGVMGIAFLIASPYTVLAWSDFIAALRMESRHLAEGHGIVLGRGWIVHLTSTLRYGLGLPMLAAGIAGLFWLARERPRDGLLLASFPVVYFLLLGSGYTVFARYMIPVVPFLCLTAAHAVTAAGRWTAERAGRPAWTTSIVFAGAALVLAPSAWSVIQFDRLISRTDNRLIAASWIRSQFPGGATIAQVGPDGGRVIVAGDDFRLSTRYTTVPFANGHPAPDIIVVQSSPLVRGESGAPGDLLAKEYDLAADLHVDAGDRRNVYDWQDEFYVPLTGFKGIQRPGPNLRIYVRRDVPRTRTSDPRQHREP
jgi:hypothetical protein